MGQGADPFSKNEVRKTDKGKCSENQIQKDSVEHKRISSARNGRNCELRET
jgi:hypothetical protein